MMVTHLTSTSDGESNAGRMPGTDTGDLAETTMGLTRKTGDSPTRDDTVVSVTLGGSTDVKRLTLSEDGADWDLLFEKALRKVNLGGSITTVDLDLHQVGNLLAKSELLDLGVSKNADNLAVSLDALELSLNILWLLGSTLGVLGEGLLLGTVPVLVESASKIIRKMVSPDGCEGAKTVRSGDVSDNTNDDHRRGLEDSSGFDSLLLVKLGARTLDLTNNVGHTGLVTNESG